MAQATQRYEAVVFVTKYRRYVARTTLMTTSDFRLVATLEEATLFTPADKCVVERELGARLYEKRVRVETSITEL